MVATAVEGIRTRVKVNGGRARGGAGSLLLPIPGCRQSLNGGGGGGNGSNADDDDATGGPP